jgi:P-type Ca2+ transporter type 2C
VGDPTEGALLVLAAKAEVQPHLLPQIVKLEDMPFNSDIKMRATLVQEIDQHQLLVVGAPEKVLDKSIYIMTPDGVVPITDVHISDMRDLIEHWSGDAMRVIALAYKDMELAPNGIEPQEVNQLVFAGIVGMIDPPRPDVKDAIMTCKQAGIRVLMATGDHVNTAIAIAKATGILDEQHRHTVPAYTEKQLLEMDEPDFEKAIMETHVFARLSPDMKLRIAEKLQEKGELIAMTGDGVNDAPALKKADVGVAMGIMGTDVARDASNVVLSDDRFSTIVSAVEQGRIVFNNTRYTSFFLLTTNFAEIATLLSAVALGMPLPLTATQILWLNLVTDGACTSTMATEQGHGDELQSKPVKPNESILNTSILPFLLMNALIMTILALGSFNFYYDGTLDTLPQARSAAFIVMAFCQLFNVFNMRSLTMSIFKIGLFSNKYINLGLFVSVCLQVMIIEVPFFERVFGFAPIPMADFVVMACLSSITLWAGECYKLVKK